MLFFSVIFLVMLSLIMIIPYPHSDDRGINKLLGFMFLFLSLIIMYPILDYEKKNNTNWISWMLVIVLPIFILYRIYVKNIKDKY
jgi:uncharacterized membrane protein